MNANTVVIVPTYNERNNLTGLIGELEKLSLSLDILIVDDNSPDGTGELAESIKNEKSNVYVIHRDKKKGLGPAYMAAFNYVLDKGDYEYIVQMDADFSHDPKDIPRLLDKAMTYDVVVGSRYTKGGGVSEEWNLIRKGISRLGNIYTRIITGLKVRDCTAGFKCYRRKALQSLELDKIFLNGYGF